MRRAYPLIAALLVHAALLPAQGAVRQVWPGLNPGDEFGTAIHSAGDLDGDGHGDVIVGAPFDLSGAGTPGTARIYSGATGAVLRTFTGTAPNQRFGFGVAPAGDVDADGTPDVIIGLSANGSTGLGPGGGARVYSGATGAVLHTFAGSVLNDGFGQFVDGLGDLDGDGHDDVIVGTAFPPGVAHPGYARVYSGATGALLYTKAGGFNGQRFGLAWAAGDVDGDGVGDFVIGAIHDNVNGTHAGSAFVYSGLTGAQIHVFHGAAAHDLFGFAAGGVGDINDDGRSDIIVGTYIPTGIGYARVHSGLDGAVLYTVTSGVVGDAFGHTVAGVGDVNGDGIADFGVSAPLASPNGLESGLVVLYSGADGAVLREFSGATAGLRYGYALNRAGDVNRDGFGDIAVGSVVSGLLPGFATVVSVCAAQRYGVGLAPTQTLDLAWTRGAVPAGDGLHVTGAVPFNPGVLLGSFAPASFDVLGLPVLVDLGAPLIAALDLTYDAAGALDLGLPLRVPDLAGLTVWLQAAEFNPLAPAGITISNGLMLLFGK